MEILRADRIGTNRIGLQTVGSQPLLGIGEINSLLQLTGPHYFRNQWRIVRRAGRRQERALDQAGELVKFTVTVFLRGNGCYCLQGVRGSRTTNGAQESGGSSERW